MSFNEKMLLIFIDKIVPVYNSRTNFDLHSYTYHTHLESNADQHNPQQWHTVLHIKFNAIPSTQN